MKTPSMPLEPGEQVRESWLANHTQHSQRATGGRLYLTDRRLVFEPNAVDRALAGRALAVPLTDVADVGRTPVDLRHFFGGGIRRRLAVRLTGGSQLLFVVNGANAKIATIQDAVAAAT